MPSWANSVGSVSASPVCRSGQTGLSLWRTGMTDAAIIALGTLLATPWFGFLLALAYHWDKRKKP